MSLHRRCRRSPAPGEVERPVTAVDADALSFPADMSVRTLRCGSACRLSLPSSLCAIKMVGRAPSASMAPYASSSCWFCLVPVINT